MHPLLMSRAKHCSESRCEYLRISSTKTILQQTPPSSHHQRHAPSQATFHWHDRRALPARDTAQSAQRAKNGYRTNARSIHRRSSGATTSQHLLTFSFAVIRSSFSLNRRYESLQLIIGLSGKHLRDEFAFAESTARLHKIEVLQENAF